MRKDGGILRRKIKLIMAKNNKKLEIEKLKAEIERLKKEIKEKEKIRAGLGR